MFMFTPNEYSDFKQNLFLWENCLFEEIKETTSELEGRAVIMLMEHLEHSQYQTYLLNCRDILKKLKGVDSLSQKMMEMMAALEQPLLEDLHATEEFVMLRERKFKLESELAKLKSDNAQTRMNCQRQNSEVLQKITQIWELCHIVSELHQVQKVTLSEILSCLRKAIVNGRVELRALAVSVFDKLCFCLNSEERVLFGLLIMIVSENQNSKTKLGEYLNFFNLEHSKHWKNEKANRELPIFEFKNKMKLNTVKLFKSAAGTTDSSQVRVSLASMMFPPKLLDSLPTQSKTGSDLDKTTTQSDKHILTISKSNTEYDSQDNFTEDSVRNSHYDESSLQKSNSKAQKLKLISSLENQVTGLKGALIQVLKFKNQFFEWLEDVSRPIWFFNFMLDGKKVGPVEMLMILKVLNLEKYLLDLKVFIDWYFSHFRQKKNGPGASKEKRSVFVSEQQSHSGAEDNQVTDKGDSPRT